MILWKTVWNECQFHYIFSWHTIIFTLITLYFANLSKKIVRTFPQPYPCSRTKIIFLRVCFRTLLWHLLHDFLSFTALQSYFAILTLRVFSLTLFPTGGGCFSPPQTDIANYGVFCIENMLFYYLTFHITGLPNFWRKNNLKFLGGTPPSGPLKI